MPEAPAEMMEAGSFRNILEYAHESAERGRVASLAEHRLRVVPAGRNPISKVVKALTVAVGVAVIAGIKGDAGPNANHARRTAAFGLQDWRWTWDDFTEGVGRFIQEFDASWDKLTGLVFDPATENSLPWLRGQADTLIRHLYESRPNHDPGDIPRLDERVNRHGARLEHIESDIGSRPEGVVNSLFHEVANLWGAVSDLWAAIAAIRPWVWERLDDLHAALTSFVETRIGQLVRGRIEPLEAGVHGLDGRLHDAEAWVGPVAATLPVALAVPALATLARNEEKLTSQCRWDIEDWNQLIDTALILFGFGAMLEVARLASDFISPGKGQRGELLDLLGVTFP